jgi:PEGA domain
MAAALLVLTSVKADAQHHGYRHSYGVFFGYGVPYFYPAFYYSAWYGPWGWYGYPWGPWPAYAYYDNSSSVRIQGAPREAEVYVDGYYAGVVNDFDGVLQRLRVPPGEHEVVIYLEGFKSTRQTILFRPGTSYKITATLEKLAPGESNEPRPKPTASASGESRPPYASPQPDRDREPPPQAAASEAAGFGTLAVRVQPAGASVIVDGERWEGPEEIGERLVVQLSEGHHRVEVRKEGYQPYTTEIEVRSGETATLNVSLPPEQH